MEQKAPPANGRDHPPAASIAELAYMESLTSGRGKLARASMITRASEASLRHSLCAVPSLERSWKWSPPRTEVRPRSFNISSNPLALPCAVRQHCSISLDQRDKVRSSAITTQMEAYRLWDAAVCNHDCPLHGTSSSASRPEWASLPKRTPGRPSRSIGRIMLAVSGRSAAHFRQ